MKKLDITDLIGNIINDVYITQDAETIMFKLEPDDQWSNDIDFFVELYGDCCSESWVSDIINIDAILSGKPVLSVSLCDLPSKEDGRTRQEYDSFYSIDIKTEKGVTVFAWRNSSNGYYGGNIGEVYVCPSYFTKHQKNLKQIKSDYYGS